MRRARRLISVAAGAASLSLLAPISRATSFNWSSTAGGTYDWTVNSNWGGAGHPTGAVNSGDDANILVNATGPINITVPTGQYFVKNLSIGGTGTAQTIDVGNANFGTGQIVLDSGGFGDTVFATVVSGGTAGGTNIISAPIQLDQTGFYSGDINGQAPGTRGNYTVHGVQGTLNSVTFFQTIDTAVFASVVIDPASTNDLTLNGTLSQATGVFSAVANAMGSNRTLTINGNIDITNAASATAQSFTITGAPGSRTVINGVINDGTGVPATIHSGMTYGNSNPNKTTVYPAYSPTIVINNANTYTGLTTWNMATLVVGNDQAFGPANTAPGTGNGELRMVGSANEFGYNLISTSDSRTIANGIRMNQFMNVTGSNSLTLTGYMTQTANRGLINTIAAGKTLTINGSIYAGLAAGDGIRTWMFDGSGLTIDNGPVYNNGNGPTESAGGGVDCPLTKVGTGTVLLNNTGNTYRGATTVNGGLLQFASPGSYGLQNAGFVPTGVFNGGTPTYTSGNIGNPSGINGTASITVGTGGAVGVATGSTAVDFLSRFTTTSVGSLALAPADAAVNIDFINATPGVGNMGAAGTVGMSIGAGNTPVTYTGTITPAASTYRLGGGGTLTLPNAQLTGVGNSVVVTNGGTVALNGLNTYGGSTTVAGSYVVSNANGALLNDFSGPLGGFEPQTLSVSHLGPASAASGIGSSSNLPSNLVLKGATLQYTGAGDATDRLFTMSGAGATLDSSGTGAVNFNNTGAIVQTDAPSAVNVTVGRAASSGAPFNTTTLPAGTDLSQLAVGMTVTDTAGALAPYAPVTILGIGGNRVLYLSFQPVSGFVPPTGDTLNFTVQNRTLTLTGSNTGANTLAAALTNSGAGTLGVSKTGTGTWFLSGTSTYSGNTTVSGGILEFTTAAAYGNTSSITAKTNGAVGLDTSSLDAAFLAKFTASSTASTALALPAADAAAAVNFTTSPLSGANLVGMSVGAVSGGTTYTGTITPAASTYRLGGGGVLTLPNTNALTGANAVVVTNSGAGVVLSGSNNYSGNTTVQSGSLTVAASGAITGSNTITVNSGATLNANGSLPSTATVNANGTTNFGGTTGGTVRTQVLATLAVGSGITVTITPSTFPFTPTLLKPTTTTYASGGKIDITNNAFATTGTAAGALAQIQSGQIVSSQPANPSNAIGYINLGGADTGKYEVRYTLKGDTNLDGGVDVGDLGSLATSYGITGGVSWANGDFNQDSTVDVGDLGSLATNYGTQLATSPSFGGAVAESLAVVGGTSAVPEPASFGLLGLGAAGLLARRGRRLRLKA